MDLQDSKACSACTKLKPLKDFSPDKRNRLGVSGRCRECSNTLKRGKYHADVDESRARRRQDYKTNAKRICNTNRLSRERHRDSVLEGKRRYYEKVKQDPEWQAEQKALRELNRERKREYDRAYAAANSQKKVQNARDWAKANPEKRRVITFAYDSKRRAWTRDGDGAQIIRKWLESAEKVCHWCSIPCASEYHIDHYQPLSRGGEHRVSNFVISCPTCNLRKNAKDPEEFAASKIRRTS